MTPQPFDPGWRAALDALSEAVWLVHEDSLTILLANDAAGQLTGLAPGDMEGTSMQSLAATPQDLALWSEDGATARDGARSYRTAQGAKLSPDGRWLLTRTTSGSGLALRLVTGGFRVLSQTATAYDWSPEATKVYAAIDRDVVALDLKGRELRRWSGLANLAVGQVNVSPDGKQLAFSADYGLAVVSVQ